MTYTDDQLAGKFKNVPFSVRNEQLLNVGQARSNHKYPKTSIQYQEPMGDEPFSESIDLFFHGVNYKDDFRKFEKAIRDPSPGRLFSPSFGIFNSIVALPTTFTSNQQTLGEITATVVFEETVEKPSPTLSNTSVQDVSNQSQVSRDTLLESFSTSYASPSTANNLSVAQADSVTLAKAIQQITKSVRDTTLFLRKVNGAISDPLAFANLLLSKEDPLGYLQSLALSFGVAINETTTTVQLLSNPIVPANNSVGAGFLVFTAIATLGNNLTNSMNDIRAGILPTRPSSSVSTPESTALNTNIPLWNNDTQEREDRNKSRLAIIELFRLLGLIGMFETASQKRYTTTDEIDSDFKKLEQYYEALVENNDSLMVSKMKSTLDELRNLTDAVLEKKKQQSYTVTTVNIVRPMSAFLIAYNLYGEYLQSDAHHEYMSDLIAGLNRSQVSYRMQGEIKVVEIGR